MKFGEIVVCRLSIFIVPNRRPPQQIVRSLKLCLGGSINGSVVVLEKDMVASALPAHVIRIRWQLLTPDEFEIKTKLKIVRDDGGCGRSTYSTMKFVPTCGSRQKRNKFTFGPEEFVNGQQSTW